jgi:hypothetical protein
MSMDSLRAPVSAGLVLLASELSGCGGSSSPSAPALTAYYVSPDGSDSNPGSIDQPLASLGQAEVLMRSSNAKVTYVRAGTYSGVALTLTSADDGEVWSYYSPDGVDSAILDGGATGPGTGGNVFTLLGASNVSIVGLTIRNFASWGIGIHGGDADPPGGFTEATATADSVIIQDNVIDGGYTRANNGWAGGGIWADGQVTNLTVANNAILNQYGSGVRVGANGDGNSPSDTISGLTVKNNVVLASDLATGDNGAIYVQDQNFASTSLSITNNFIRDYQSAPNLRNATVPARDVAIYLDRGASNVIVSGNVIAPTADPIEIAGGNSTQAFFIGSGHSNSITGNIVDLGSSAWVLNLAYELYHASDIPMTGNRISSNIFIGNWSGAQLSGFFGVDGIAYAAAGAGLTVPAVQDNLYYNYGGGSISASGNVFNDSAPLTGEDPQLSGTTYSLAATSPAKGAPVDFPGIAGSWGPPGYSIPASGAADSPSYATQ